MAEFGRISGTTGQTPVEAFCEGGLKSPSSRNRDKFFSAAGRHQHVKKSTMDGCLWCVLTESLDTVAANGHVVLSASDRIMNMEHRWRDY